ncbi:MAG: hypothetical protein ABW185_28110, partial [Sedimenticola sp.]
MYDIQIIEVYKIIHHFDDIGANIFFTFSDNPNLRGHNYKLNKPRENKSIRLNSFAHRTINTWNSLPADLVNADTILSFKTKLDKLWCLKRFDTSAVY